MFDEQNVQKKNMDGLFYLILPFPVGQRTV